MSNYLLGIDVGRGGPRALVIDSSGRVVGARPEQRSRNGDGGGIPPVVHRRSTKTAAHAEICDFRGPDAVRTQFEC